MPSMSFTLSHSSHPQLLHSPRNPNIFTCNYSNTQEPTHEWDGLKFIRGKKPLKDLSTWGIGGPCNYFVEIFDQNQLASALRYCHQHSIRHMIIGKGSNCLFDDLGFDGCVILNRIEFLDKIEHGVYRVGSGFGFNRLGVWCCNEGFTGLEFAGGIPGTVGGATFMNAGANGQETAGAIESVDIVTTEGKCQTLYRIDLKFGYRTSPFQDKKELAAIAAVTFRLEGSRTARIRQQEYLERRKRTQPLRERSAGSVFRNPSELGVAAAELIEKAGLKGLRIGGAMISDIHANFFINAGGSTSQDMLDLIALAKEKVDQKFGVQLKNEIIHVHPYSDGLIPNKNKYQAM